MVIMSHFSWTRIVGLLPLSSLLLLLLVVNVLPLGAAEVVLWNKLGSQAEVENSEIGPNGVITWGNSNIDYNPAQFGNGIRVDGVGPGGSHVELGTSTITGKQLGQEGTLEFWVKPDHSSSDGGIRRWIDSAWQPGVFETSIYWRGWDHVITFACFVTGFPGKYVYAFKEFNAGDLLHIAAVWNVHGIEGTSDTYRAYINGELAGTSSDTWVMVDNMCELKFGYTDYSQYATVDNLVVFSGNKTDFSDRFRENPVPLPAAVWLLGSGLVGLAGLRWRGKK